MIGGDNASADESKNFHNDYKEDILEPSFTEETCHAGLTDQIKENGKGVTVKKKTQRAERSVAIAGSNVTNMDAKSAVDELVEKTEAGWRCKQCGKISKSNISSDIRRHAEIHIEGLSFNCQHCEKTFRSRDLLKAHRYRHHKL